MAWTVLRTVTDSVDYVTAADHNETKANFDIIGGTDGATKTGNWYVSGNVGIGTTSPLSTLHVVKAAGATLRVTTETGAGGGNSSILMGNQDSGGTNKPFILRSINAGLYLGTGDSWSSETGGTLTTRMIIDSSGNVGIGTTSPEDVLHVKGTAQWVQPIIDSSTSTTGGSSVVLRGNQNSWALSSRSSANGTTNNGFSIFETLAANIRFVIQTGGNVGIGTTSPGYQLTLSTDSAAKPTSNTWTISSDARMKTVIGPYTRGVADIMALEPKMYRLNGAFGSVDDGRVHVSVIAQEAQATWPEMVGTYEHADKDEDGVETVTELLNLNTNELQWAMVNAIKELVQRVEALEA